MILNNFFATGLVAKSALSPNVSWQQIIAIENQMQIRSKMYYKFTKIITRLDWSGVSL